MSIQKSVCDCLQLFNQDLSSKHAILQEVNEQPNCGSLLSIKMNELSNYKKIKGEES